MNGLNRTLFQSKRIQILIIVLLTLIAYSNIFQNGFVHGDIQMIVNYKITRSFNNIPLFFTQPAPEEDVYRPIRTVFLLLNFKLWGTNPIGYHFFSLMVILVNSVLVYLLALELTKNRVIAFVTGLLFATHPIHTDAQTQSLASIETVSISFFLISFYFYCKARSLLHIKAAKFLPKYSKYYYGSIAFAALAFFHNEITLSLPLVIVLYDFYFHKLSFKKEQLTNNLKIYGPYFLIALVYVFIRFFLLHIVGRGEGYLGGSFYLTMLTMTKAFVKYIELMILPIDLAYFPKIAADIPAYTGTLTKMDKILSQSILDLDILRNIGIILGLIAAIFIFLKRSPLISFAIAWFFITLLPVSNIIPVGAIMFERYAYLASFGFVLLLALIFNYLLQSNKLALFHLEKLVRLRIIRTVLIFFLIIIVSGYSFRTYLRNRDYKDQITFWLKNVSQNPDDITINWILSEHYAQADQDDLAIKYMLKAADLNPNFNQEELNIGLGRVYNKRGEKAKALENFRKSKDLKEYELESSAPGLSENRIIFFYPKQWQVTSVNSGVRIDDKNGYSGEIILDHLAISRDEYLDSQKVQGNVVQQGLAKIPNVDIAYVREIYDNGNDLIQLFWFKGNKVIKIIYPAANFTQRNTFENILRSFVILD